MHNNIIKEEEDEKLKVSFNFVKFLEQKVKWKESMQVKFFGQTEAIKNFP